MMMTERDKPQREEEVVLSQAEADYIICLRGLWLQGLQDGPLQTFEDWLRDRIAEEVG